jgi:hypothetical protein
MESLGQAVQILQVQLFWQIRRKGQNECVLIKKSLDNSKMVRDRYPLPLIEDLIDRLRGARYFSSIDMENGFFQVRVQEDSKKYTSFVVPSGQYEFNYVPFGLTNAPAVFMRFVHRIFRPLMLENILLVFMFRQNMG